MDIAAQVVQQPGLHDEAAGGDAKDAAEAAPEQHGAGDDGVLGLRAGDQQGHEGAGQLEAGAEAAGEESEPVKRRGEAPTKQHQHEVANGGEDAADEKRPPETPRAGDEEPGEDAGDGGGDGWDDETQARGRGGREEDGLKVERPWDPTVSEFGKKKKKQKGEEAKLSELTLAC